MPENITCPGCQRRLRLPESVAGQAVVCPVCRTTFQAGAVPAAEVPIAIPVPPLKARVEEIPMRPEWDAPSPPAPSANPWAELNQSEPNKKKTPTGLHRPEVKLLIGIVLFTCAGVVCSGWRPWAERPPVVVFTPENPDIRRDELIQALANPQPLAPDQLADELKPLLQGMGEAFRARDRNRIVTHFDGSRMLDELLAQGIFPPGFVRDRPTVLRALNDSLGRALERQAQLVQWTDFEIRSVKALDNLDAVVIVRHTTDDGNVFLKMRWWVTRRSGAWKVYDMEDLDAGLRFSNVAGSLAGMGLGQLNEMTRATNLLREALEAVAAHNVGVAELKLKQLDGLKLPAKLEPLRLMTSGVAHIQRGEYKEALQAFDDASQLQPDMPALDLLRGIAYNALGQWETARKHLQAYRDLLGDDPLVCTQHGLSLRGVRQWADAAESYRRALDLNPKSAEAFRGLLNSLEHGAARDDLIERFLKIDNPRGHFETFASEAKENRDGGSLEQLALGMTKIDPAYAAADYYLALALAWRGQTEQAAAPLRRALAQEKNPKTRRDFLLGVLQAILDANQLADAYAAAPDAREAFAVLAPELKKRYRQDQLRELVAIHAKNQPDDPLLPFYRAETLVSEYQYKLAEKEFAAGLAKLNDAATLAPFRSSRVTARYHIGHAVMAYQEIGPREETFEQLANLCFMDQNYPLLQTLLDLHAKNEPETFEVLRARARLQVKQKQIAEGIASFKAANGKLVPKDRRERFVGDFLRDMVEAGQPVKAYEAAPDSQKALPILAEALIGRGMHAELRALLDAHRKRHPDDAWLSYYTGEILLDEQAWEKAATAFGEAFRQDPNEERFRSNYVYAMYKTGRGLTAYRQANEKNRSAIYNQLVNLLIRDKKAAELEQLLDLHAKAPDAHQGSILLNRARARVFANKPAEAIPLFRQACDMDLGEIAVRGYVWTFVGDMYDAGLPLEAYRASPDKYAAFEAIARRFVTDKKAVELEKLLADHAPGRADDAWVCYFTGELYLLRNDPIKAEPEFAAAVANQAKNQSPWIFRNGLNRARIRAGKIVAVYQEAGANQRAFYELANLCLQEKNSRQLEALIAAHRRAQPDDTGVLFWDLEVLWLRQDYEEVLKMLTQHQDEMFASPRYSWKTADYHVRALVKLKRTREAIQQAELLLKKHRGNVILLVLAHAAEGDVKQTIRAMEQQESHRYSIEGCYVDDDLGPILRSDAFKEFRQRFPEPDNRRPRDDDD